MKVSSAPFEPPSVVSTPSSRALDPSTQVSLARLASLIRSQVKASEVADDAAKSDAKREEAEAKAKEARTVHALRSLETTGTDDGLSREIASRQNYPAVERVERQLREATRRRGAKVYKEISRATAISSVLAQVPPAHPDSDIDAVDSNIAA